MALRHPSRPRTTAHRAPCRTRPLPAGTRPSPCTCSAWRAWHWGPGRGHAVRAGAGGCPGAASGAASGAAPGEARRAFSIPAGPLGQALNAFAASAGVELTVDSSLLQGRSSSGLSGSYSVAEGFAELLRGQGLRALREANGSYTLGRDRNAAAPVDGGVLMPAVTVRAQAQQAPEAYAGGQVSTGGRMGLLGDKDFMETPFNTISYTEKFIADRQARDITDVISAADPTVFSTGMTGIISENYSIRGFSSSIGDVTFGGLFGVAPFYRASPEMFERVDVLKGPSALLNGMPPGGSVGGTVNLVPKRAGDEPLTRLTTSSCRMRSWAPTSTWAGGSASASSSASASTACCVTATAP